LWGSPPKEIILLAGFYSFFIFDLLEKTFIINKKCQKTIFLKLSFFFWFSLL